MLLARSMASSLEDNKPDDANLQVAERLLREKFTNEPASMTRAQQW